MPSNATDKKTDTGPETQGRRQSFLQGALILSVAAILTKVLGMLLFKIPLQKINREAYGNFITAYDIYAPIYTIATAGFPVAVSRMVAEYRTLGRLRDVAVIRRVANRVFFVTGLAGTLIMVVMAFLYTRFINMPDSRLTMLIMAPSILFCCMVASYRGVCEGSRDMYPTAISQVLEVVVKLAFGIGLAKAAQVYGLWCWEQGRPVYGQWVEGMTETQALTWSIPYIAAGGMVGVTMGALAAMLFMAVRHKIRGDGIPRAQFEAAPPASSMKTVFKALVAIAVPVALGTMGWQIALLIDALSLNWSLATVIENNKQYFTDTFGHMVSSADKIQDYLLANRGTAMTYVNLVPNVTLSLGISALPVITAAWAQKNSARLKNMVTMVVRITLLISIPSGLGIAALAGPLMTMIYGKGTYPIAGDMLLALGFAIIFICLSAPVNAMLQAMGRADVPVKAALIGGGIKLVFNLALINIPQINVMGAAYSMVACYTVMVVYTVFMLQRIMGERLPWGRVVVKPLIAAGLCAAAAWAVDRGLGQVIHPRVATVVAIAAAVGIYAGLLFLLKAVTKDEIRIMLRRGGDAGEGTENAP